MANQQVDFLTGMRIRELILFGLITITAVLANLPKEYVEETLGLNPNALLAVLGCAVVFGLFLYLKFFFFLATVLLIVGANLPEQIATGLDISKVPLILALITLVGVSLINYVVKMLPTGLEPKPKESSPEAIFAMFYGIEKNNVICPPPGNQSQHFVSQVAVWIDQSDSSARDQVIGDLVGMRVEPVHPQLFILELGS